MVSYKELNLQLLAVQAPNDWFPNERRMGSGLRVGDVYGSKGSSLWICLHTGRWKDFATDQSGRDLISLYAEMHGLSKSMAKSELGGGYYISKTSAPSKATKAPKADDA